MAKTNRKPWRIAGPVAALALLLTACQDIPLPFSPTRTERETTPYVSMPRARLWVRAPGAVYAMRRSLTGIDEQRIVYGNLTPLRGDNFMLLQALNGEQLPLARFTYDSFERRIGELPAPFQGLDPRDLRTGEDELGTYFWAEERIGAINLCVLGFRRLTTGLRQLPPGKEVVDVMLRNCTTGSVDEALAPMKSTSVSGFIPAGRSGNDDRMLSPLAGPTPQ